MPETYSIMIFFFVPITEKTFFYEKILFFCWFLNNQSIKESFLSIPTLCFIVISFDILSKKKYIKPIFLNLSYLMAIGSCFPKVNWSWSLQTEKIRKNTIFLLVINSQRELPSGSLLLFGVTDTFRCHQARWIVSVLHWNGDRGTSLTPSTPSHSFSTPALSFSFFLLSSPYSTLKRVTIFFKMCFFFFWNSL